MKKCSMKMFLKSMLGVFIFALCSIGYLENAKANTISTASADGNAVKVEESVPLDMNTVMSALEGKVIKDGDRIEINDDYDAVCEVILQKTAGSGIRLMSVTSSYGATCNIYIMHSGTNTNVAVITHIISLTYNDSALVHINSGSVSVNTLVSYVTGYAYGYSITNTDGSYSSASGMIRLYDSTTGYYYYYGCGVSVTRGGTPSFSFSQV
jgi:hypothetical protein